ncbi:MAG: hypothetical protein ACKO3W_09300, partial [bacterium]
SELSRIRQRTCRMLGVEPHPAKDLPDAEDTGHLRNMNPIGPAKAGPMSFSVDCAHAFETRTLLVVRR